jgi:hypothetical protein
MGDGVFPSKVTLFRCKVFACTGCFQAEREREREREATAAEDGWTVVVNKGGRTKNTDDSGISVGAVDVTPVTEHAKKKQREEGILDFFYFQKHEARWNGVICQEFPLCLHPYFGSLSWLPVQFVSLFIIPIAGSLIRHKHLIVKPLYTWR